MADVHAFRIENERPAIARLLDRIEPLLTRERVAETEGYALCVALDEVLANVATYAYQGEDRCYIDVRLSFDSDSIVAEIEDDGIAFDPLEAAEPDTTLPLEERPVGGLGIHLVRQLMDEVVYRRDGGRNRLTLVKYRACGGAKAQK